METADQVLLTADVRRWLMTNRGQCRHKQGCLTKLLQDGDIDRGRCSVVEALEVPCQPAKSLFDAIENTRLDASFALGDVHKFN